MSSENTAAPQTPKPSSSGGTLDRYFNITERGSTISTEIRGGLATFFAMSYIVVLNPLILGLTPDSSGRSLGVPQVAAMTALVAGVMTILLGVYAKHPFAMAAGLGVNALLATTIATTPNLTWPQIMGLVMWAGVLMTALVLTGFRTAVFDAVPESLKTAIVVGIGLFIAFVGLVNAGIVRRAETGSTPVVFGVHGHLLGWPTLVFIVGLFLTIILYVRQVRGAILYGMLASTALSLILEAVAPSGSVQANPLGWSLNVPTWDGSGFGLPDFSLLFSADLFGAFSSLGAMASILLVFTILISAFFDVMGSIMGMAVEAGSIDEDGKIKDIDRLLLVDALGAVAGGGTSTSTNQVFVESATGIGAGARTGLANVVTGVLFLGAIFLSPLVTIVPFEAVAPAMVFVGFLMVRQAVNVDWNDLALGISAFLTIVIMPLSYSIAHGIGAGFISYTVIRVATGRGREVHWLMYVVSAVFAVHFGMGLIEGWMR